MLQTKRLQNSWKNVEEKQKVWMKHSKNAVQVLISCLKTSWKKLIPEGFYTYVKNVNARNEYNKAQLDMGAFIIDWIDNRKIDPEEQEGPDAEATEKALFQDIVRLICAFMPNGKCRYPWESSTDFEKVYEDVSNYKQRG